MPFPHLLRTGALLFAGQIFVALAGIVTLRLYTEVAPRQVFGQANLILSALNLGLQVVVLPFVSVQLRYLSEAEAAGQGARFSTDARRWSLRAATVLAALVCVAMPLARVAGAPSCGWIALVAAVVWIYAMAVRHLAIARLQSLSRRKTYVALQALEPVLLGAFTFGALKIAQSADAYLVGQALAVLLFMAVAAAWARRPVEAPASATAETAAADSHYWSRMLSYGLPFSLLSVMGWFANLADRYVVGLMLGAAAAGQYVAQFAIASRGMTMANGALVDLYRPALFDAENHKNHAQANKVFRHWTLASFGIGVLAVATVAVAGRLTAQLLLAAEYRQDAVETMLWVAAAYAVAGFTQVLEHRQLSLGRSSRLLPSLAVGAVTNVAFAFLLVSHHGVVGAAQATFASFVAQALATAAFLFAGTRVPLLPSTMEPRC